MASKRNTIVFRAVYGCVTTTTKIMIQIKKIMVWKFLSPWNVPLCRPFTINSFPCQPLANTNLLSVTAIFFLVFSRISCKWNHTACDLLCLTSFTYHNGFEIHPHCFWALVVPFYWWNNSIGLGISDCLFTSWWSFGLLLVFCLLWRKLLWKFVYKYLCGLMLSFLLGKYLRMRFLEYMSSVWCMFI